MYTGQIPAYQYTQETEKEMTKLASIRLLLLESGVFRAACRGGSLEIIKWLRSKGCPWDPDSDYAACQGGHLETLMWLRSEGCPITE